MTDDSPIRIAVIGSGPAGFYAAGHLLKDSTGRIEVDMLERLPTPWGLVRSGVAPDHPKIKSVTRVYEKTAEHSRFRFFGNINFGEHVSREDLLAHYHDALCRRGVRGYALEQLRADTRLDTFGGVLMAIVASMVVQRTERGDLMFLTSTTRHAQHALDVDAPALLVAAG